MIEFSNLSSIKVKESFIKSISAEVLKGEGQPHNKAYVSLVGPEQIRQLKKEYLGIDKTTDVLSFREPSSDRKSLELPDRILGEIIICPEIVKENSQKFKFNFERELAKVLIHGLLHILGYAHNKDKGRKMKQKEELYLKRFVLKTKK